MTDNYSKYRVGIEYRRVLNEEVGDITQGYFPWMEELEAYAQRVIQDAKSELGADRAVGEAIMQAINPLKKMWANIRRDGYASPDDVQAVAVLSAVLMDFSNFGLTLEGKHAIHRRRQGGAKGAESKRSGLSDRNADILKAHAEGMTYRAIAERFNLSAKQVGRICRENQKK